MDEWLSPLHALIDLRWMHPGLAGGIENLSRSFLNHLLQLDSSNRYTVLVPSEVRYDFDTRHCSNFALIASDGPSTYLRRAVLNARDHRSPMSELEALQRIHELRADVALSIPGYINPDLAALRNVEILPDIQHEYLPEFFSPQALEERRRIYTASARQAAHICAISEFTRRTLIERLNIPPGRITTTHLAADPMFHPGSSARRGHHRVLERYGLRAGDYLLFPANTWPHKNHVIALEALRVLREAYDLDPLLVCAGAPKEAHGELLAKVKDAGLESRVRFLGYCHPTYMPALYQGAAALVFPSLFEGFGLPPLEAMWCDCPIVCSNVTSLPEIVGDAALLVDPRSPEALADAMNRVLTDADLRCRLIERSRERVKRFSWTKFTREVVSVLHQVRPLRESGHPESGTERPARADPINQGIGPERSSFTPRHWQLRLSSVLFQFNRVGLAREHVRRMTESWERGDVLRTFSHAVSGAVLAPHVAFSVGLYPSLRDRVLEKVVGHMEQRRLQQRRQMEERQLQQRRQMEERRLQQRRLYERTEPWSDRWVGPRLVIQSDAGHATEFVALSGWTDLRHVRGPLVLTVSVDKDMVGRHTVSSSGRFVVRIPMAGPLAPGRHTVEVEASAWWIPDRYLRNGDLRPLAWMMYLVRLESAVALTQTEHGNHGRTLSTARDRSH
jgi:glycosyltransferase involved in cell wall biosynthesis